MFADRFQGQAAIVTGSGSGIGLAVGTRLAREGGSVLLADKDEAALALAEAALGGVPGRVEMMRADITEEADVRGLVETAVDRFGGLDVVVNSAGITGKTGVDILDYDLPSFRAVLDVNLIGSFLVTKYALGAMLPRGYGRILLLASIAGKEGNPGMAGYSVSKAGVIGLAKAIGKEYAHTAITVNALAPALIATPLILGAAEESLNYMTSKIPMGRLGTVEEAAAIACWIVSGEASFNTGAVFDLSGGRATY
ncbi:MAG: SDR family NAD(P)-dependent oxidoreductase [Chloroflexota bacterium]|nr:SDR family NAD(P)-dependent oxidoreductase [Chloroflexota bacterium]MDE2947775.1 SDR family NAD(P)-dependent oxidoreductase [Chloroflexota bacterium]